jgi:putative transposase
MQRDKAVSTSTDVLSLSHQPTILADMHIRYRYRLHPTPTQRQALARAFGCARVVYNDGLRLREDVYRAGQPYVGDAELSRRVITVAKRTPERAWLGEVSAVVLQQSLADLDRAYRNYFRAVKELKAARARGEKAKLKVRKPRFKSRHHDQAVRFTRNSCFRVTLGGRLSLPKVGDLRVRWSRPLPAQPSSVTVTLDGAGRYHASFVVEVREAPLLATTEDAVGIDPGLTAFATLSTEEKVDNPRWLRQREKALRRSQRNMSRKQFSTMLAYKADLYGRTLVRVDKWCPSSRLCSACGHRDTPKPLKVRAWTCPACGAHHDRDVNAAKNILAAGLAVAACGGGGRPGASQAVAGEAGTHLVGVA